MGYLSGRTGRASTHSIARREAISGPEERANRADVGRDPRRAVRPALMRAQAGDAAPAGGLAAASVVSFARSGFGLTGPDNSGNPVATCSVDGVSLGRAHRLRPLDTRAEPDQAKMAILSEVHEWSGGVMRFRHPPGLWSTRN